MKKDIFFIPGAVHEIPPKEFVKAKKLARAITLSEFEVDPDEWKKISDENSVCVSWKVGKRLWAKKTKIFTIARI